MSQKQINFEFVAMIIKKSRFNNISNKTSVEIKINEHFDNSIFLFIAQNIYNIKKKFENVN